MEMYSKIDKMTMTELKENLNRIEKIISNINFTSSLKDKGEKMKLTKVKLEKEIHLRETLQQAEEKVANLSLTNNSEVIVHNTQYTQKLCKVEKEPKMLRFIPALTPNVSAQLHSTKPINLPESLKLQSDQICSYFFIAG
ncbi:uncharacterized protein LOC132708675 isoform X2 [Cylas formicarius]|uniref:uncharacterized protein LOC132708675 isoform X2 n=1 Tax=Cylas formicarius TaxID=197179 RepID=UPI0029586914|nr:uncharacterized protein LOC132708675 isoform X2 [Cylas formicarius]